MRILCLDGGSSSLKFALYDMDAPAGSAHALLLSGAAEGFKQQSARFWLRSRESRRRVDESNDDRGQWDATAAFVRLEAALSDLGQRPDATGHRIVFGGADHVSPTVATPEVLGQLERLAPIDPLHLTAEIAVARMALELFPDAPAVLCFDTAFHQRMPAIAKRLPLPRDLGSELQRYGFHGLSYEYVVEALGDAALGNVVIAHLGNGASMCAVRSGQPVDTTMGFSPLGGLMMGTRPGDLDPGTLLYLLTAKGYEAEQLSQLLNERSGLLGMSGSTADMEALLKRSAQDSAAADAVSLFVYQACKHAAAMACVLGGLDTLVFTGGMGERAPLVRSGICQGLAHLGVRLDDALNAVNASAINAQGSSVSVRVIPTDENLMIARHTQALLG
ncbi:MAG: acetate/propionate family kinase [Candidatus Eremiobacteraeota bacterium]|nr:acetate/propionate family kinase [Candidatus Eremiobacteraeota bacterium]